MFGIERADAPSFLLIPCPEKCNDSPNNHEFVSLVLKEITIHWVGGWNEDVVPIAFDCPDINGIPEIVHRLAAHYVTLEPTDDNVEKATWTSWCSFHLMQSKFGSYASANGRESIQRILQKEGMDIARGNFIIVRPDGDDLDYKDFTEKIRQKMPFKD